MSRPQGIEYVNAYYHVMNRGAGRRKIFNNAPERKLFLTIISEAHIQFNIETHSYCLKTNHYHLLVKTPSSNLSRAMQHINSVYTQRYNRLNHTDGPLFRGRYKSILVDSDSYLLHLSKYIHLNPLEARMVDNLSDFIWSSYRTYIGDCDLPCWLFQSEIYGQLTTRANKNEIYRLFMNDTQLHDEVKTIFDKERLSPILGNEEFIRSIQHINQSEEIPRADRLFNRPTIKQIMEETAKEFSQNNECDYQKT